VPTACDDSALVTESIALPFLSLVITAQEPLVFWLSFTELTEKILAGHRACGTRCLRHCPWKLVYAKERLKNNFGILAGCGCGRQAASTYILYACFTFLRSLVLAAPKHPIYWNMENLVLGTRLEIVCSANQLADQTRSKK